MGKCRLGSGGSATVKNSKLSVEVAGEDLLSNMYVYKDSRANLGNASISGGSVGIYGSDNSVAFFKASENRVVTAYTESNEGVTLKVGTDNNGNVSWGPAVVFGNTSHFMYKGSITGAYIGDNKIIIAYTVTETVGMYIALLRLSGNSATFITQISAGDVAADILSQGSLNAIPIEDNKVLVCNTLYSGISYTGTLVTMSGDTISVANGPALQSTFTDVFEWDSSYRLLVSYSSDFFQNVTANIYKFMLSGNSFTLESVCNVALTGVKYGRVKSVKIDNNKLLVMGSLRTGNPSCIAVSVDVDGKKAQIGAAVTLPVENAEEDVTVVCMDKFDTNVAVCFSGGCPPARGNSPMYSSVVTVDGLNISLQDTLKHNDASYSIEGGNAVGLFLSGNVFMLVGLAYTENVVSIRVRGLAVVRKWVSGRPIYGITKTRAKSSEAIMVSVAI